MSVFVSGSTGFVGRHVMRSLAVQGRIIVDNMNQADTVIHLAWGDLSNYESPNHIRNVGMHVEFLRQVAARGISNVTVAGTCLETLELMTPYSIAKLAVRARATEMFPDLKWARLWYLYGEGQNENCLLPRLRKAKRMGEKEFSVIDGRRDFINVAEAGEQIVRIALQSKVTGIIDCCSGTAESVSSFCRRQVPGIKLRENYPRPHYEPDSFHGDPTKIRAIM